MALINKKSHEVISIPSRTNRPSWPFFIFIEFLKLDDRVKKIQLTGFSLGYEELTNNQFMAASQALFPNKKILIITDLGVQNYF
jgi:hypothetical protein